MSDKLDKLLKHALTPTNEPDFWLNHNILNQAKERETMNIKTGKTMRRVPAAALAAAVVLGCGSITAFAAWKYLSPQLVAEQMGESKLADAFSAQDAIFINETQRYGGYDVTLLGIISGKDLSEYPVFDDNGTILDMDKTYSVVAIKNSDGRPMPKTSDEEYADLSFFVSPLIKDYDPAWYNAITMNGGYQEFSENGILYRIAECDNVEMFADHGLYLCVNDGTFYKDSAYQFNEKTGEISRNDSYTGLNALFDLPIDATKADPSAAEAYIKSMKEENEQTDTERASASADWLEQLTAENIDTYAQRLEDSVKICKPDRDGYITYGYEKDGDSFEGTRAVDGMFAEDQKFVVGGCTGSEDDLTKMLIETFTLNEDGTITYAVYRPKES